jgi:hypothetical protein
MSTLLSPLVLRLRPFTLAELEAIADAAGVARSLPRKLISGERDNPGVKTIQPLVDYFAAVDAGEKALPADVSEKVGG